jgi:hypothetical protein
VNHILMTISGPCIKNQSDRNMTKIGAPIPNTEY